MTKLFVIISSNLCTLVIAKIHAKKSSIYICNLIASDITKAFGMLGITNIKPLQGSRNR